MKISRLFCIDGLDFSCYICVIDETKKIKRNGKICRLRFPKEAAKKLFRFIYNGKSGYAL